MDLSIVVPLTLAGAGLFGLCRKTDIYTALCTGSGEGVKVLLRIFPALVALLTAVHMLRASGLLDQLVSVFSPLFHMVGIPPETAILVFIRPLSGSAALAIGAELMAQYGVDSLIGRTAAIMLGSTETTFYTISVYFGAAKIKKTRYAIPAAIIADLVGFIMAALFARLTYA